MNNILIEEGTHRPFITDFGLADDDAPKADFRYDYHFLFNSIYNFLKHPDPSIINFIKKVIPKEYLVQDSSKVHHFRLRRGDHPELPTLKQILKDKYFSSFTC